MQVLSLPGFDLRSRQGSETGLRPVSGGGRLGSNSVAWKNRRLASEPLEADPPGPVADEIASGRHCQLPGRCTGTYVREIAGPKGAPTLLLIHGWLATGGLNWFRVFEPLSRHFNLIVPDMRGHGRGPKSWRRFELEDCADDLAALVRSRKPEKLIAVGYSMGGAIAQHFWRRHPHLVDGLVLCATADRLQEGQAGTFAFRAVMAALAGAVRLSQLRPALIRRLGSRSVAPSGAPAVETATTRWAADQMRNHDLRMLVEAGYALSRHDSRDWIGEVDVPTSVVVTLQDRAIPPEIQTGMADRIPGARVFPLEDGHVACNGEKFAGVLLEACLDVRKRSRRRRARCPTKDSR